MVQYGLGIRSFVAGPLLGSFRGAWFKVTEELHATRAGKNFGAL